MSRNRSKIVAFNPEVRPKSSPLEYVLAQQKFRVRQDIATFRLAIESANNITNYNRFLLHQIYREVMMDTMINSQWESRKMKTKEKEFKLCPPNGKENMKVSEIFRAPWFLDWIDAVLDSKLWGFSLIEFGEVIDGQFSTYAVKINGSQTRIFDPITIIDRDNVKPEMGIITETYGQNQGVSFDDKLYKDFLMFVGQTHDLGLLYKLSKIALFKNNALGNWSEWIEVFGMDKRIGYTRTQDTDRVNFMKAMRDLGNNGYGVFNDGDKVEYLGTTRTDAYKAYSEPVAYFDAQISKIIFGQDVISNNTGHVIGKVGENVSNMYGDTDAKFVSHMVNMRLMPFMENLGFNFGGCRFDWDTTEKLTMTEKADRDLKITQMGKRLTDEYVERTYQVTLDETPEIDPEIDKTYPKQ